MTNNRRSERHLTLRTGKIMSAGGADALECAILNVSAHGACLLVPSSVEVPHEFSLSIDGETAMRSCTVAWKSGARLGVSFDLSRRMDR
jgi:hypothetical protein